MKYSIIAILALAAPALAAPVVDNKEPTHTKCATGKSPYPPRGATSIPSEGNTHTQIACNKAFYACKAKPDANQAGCVGGWAGCLGFNPFEAHPTGPYPDPKICKSDA